MKIQQFNGGLNTRLAPQMLELTQSTELTNVDVTKGILTPIKDKAPTEIVTEQYAVYYDAGDEWISSTQQTEYLEFQGNLYWTDGTQPKKYRNGVANNLGIAPPTTVPFVDNIASAPPIREFTTENLIGSGGDLPYQDLEYLLVNEENGVYTRPYKFTVYASSTSAVRASGALLELSEDGFYSGYDFRGNFITTLVGSDRSVQFSSFKGVVADKAKIFRYYNNTWHKVGEITSLFDTILDDVEDISLNEVLDLDTFSAFNGTYQYTYTYYNENDGTESAPVRPTKERDIDSGAIELSFLFSSSDPQVTHKRIYRVGGNVTQFTLVDEIPDSQTTYVDSKKDSELVGDLLESDNYYEAPTNLRFLSESYAMLFGAVGPTLRFTPVGKPNAWPPEYSIEFDSDITGLGPVANGLLVMTKYATFIVTGTGPLSLAQQTLRGDQGCIDHRSVQQVTRGMLCWASADGLCVSSGNNVEVITKNMLGRVELSPVSSAVVDEVYYCLNSDGTTLVWDFRFKPTFYNLNLGVSSLAVANSQLYGWQSGIQHLMFKGENKLDILYKSPRFIEGSMTLPKTYKKFYFSHKGDIIINILIDDIVVATKNLTGKDTTEVMVPQAKQRGYYVQFEVQGTGDLLEIEYTASVNRSG